MAALSIAYYNVASVQQGAQLQQDIVELSMLLRQLDSVRFDMRGSIHWGQGRIAIRPPSIGNSSPVIQRASSLAR